jgi:hypothetical protein
MASRSFYGFVLDEECGHLFSSPCGIGLEFTRAPSKKSLLRSSSGLSSLSSKNRLFGLGIPQGFLGIQVEASAQLVYNNPGYT